MTTNRSPMSQGRPISRRVLLAGALTTASTAALARPSPAAAADPVAMEALGHPFAATVTTTVANAGFEEPATGGVIPGWSRLYAEQADGFSIVTDPVHTGARALLMEDPSNTGQIGMISDPVPVTPGRSYEFGAWAQVNAGIPSIIVYFYDSAGSRVDTASLRIRDGAPGEWLWYSFTASVPANASTARLILYSSTLDVTSVVWDDVAIKQVSSWTETSLGHPLVASNIFDAAYGIGPDGREEVYVVTAAVPARFNVIDVKTGRLKHAEALPSGANGSWALVTGLDGSVYVGTFSNGRLYRWSPATSTLTDLGRVTPNATYVWDLEVDANGVVWGGTYPQGEVFSFDPATQTFRNYGRVSEQEYVRSVAVRDGLVYAGLGSANPRIVELNPETGATREIALPESHRGEQFVYHMDIRGNLLYTRLSPGSEMLVYDLVAQKWVANLGTVTFGGVSTPGPKQHVYYVDGESQLQAFDPVRRTSKPTGLTDLKPARDFGWVMLGTPNFPGRTLAFVYQTGEMVFYNPVTGKHRTQLTEAETAPVRLHGVGKGPDGKIYVSGYQYEGLAAYDPADDTTWVSPRFDVGQIEGMLAHGGRLYLGTYPRAHLFAYDPNAPWDGSSNPVHLGSLHDLEQDRPFAITSVGGKVAFGTVPVYGKLGGALTVYDPANGSLETHRNLVPDQSIVSLTSAGTVIYGGTSIWGGLGAIPTAETAKLFAWDSATRTMVWQVELDPEAQAITSVTVGPDGRLWAIDSGRLYEIDPADGQILRGVQLSPQAWSDTHIWVEADLEFDEQGTLFALSRGTLFEVDPETLTTRTLTSGLTDYTVTHDGESVYYTKSDRLCRLSPSP
ncbi:MAG TPA: carbohydrate binding domain-containing protein [Actinopolymorphaceae bacterium]|jgi:streptogramin lyase